MDEYEIYIRGFSVQGAEAPDAGLQRVFGIERGRARELIRSLPRIVKRHVPASHVARYEQALRELGADYELRRSPIRPAQTIAVHGAQVRADAAEREQHGSTLTLPPPTLDRAPTETGRAAGRAPAARFAQTVLGNADQLSATQARSSAATLAAYSLDAAQDLVLDPIAPLSAPRVPADPAPPLALARSDARALTPAAHSSAVADPWDPIEPSPGPAGAGSGELPQPWEVPGLRLDGRPDWLMDGPRAYQAKAAEDAYAAEEVGGFEPIISDRAPAASAAPHARPRSLRSASTAAHPVGNVIGRELAHAEPTLLLRIGLRVGIGVSLFVILATVRHLRVFDRDFDRALARFADATLDEPAPTQAEPGEKRSAGGLGPDAIGWVESDLHQFTNGDKDRVRSLVQRFSSAGAPAIHVGHITRSGMVQIAGELIVELPDDPVIRKAVLEEYQHFLQGTFGELAGAPQDPGGRVLRVAL